MVLGISLGRLGGDPGPDVEHVWEHLGLPQYELEFVAREEDTQSVVLNLVQIVFTS